MSKEGVAKIKTKSYPELLYFEQKSFANSLFLAFPENIDYPIFLGFEYDLYFTES